MRSLRTLLVFVGLLSGACQSKAPLTEEEALIQKGKNLYASLCISCHNLDPSQAGALGPALSGSSLELLQAKVLKGQYPTGYQPKVAAQKSKIQMPPMPYLEKEIPAIHAFLNAPK